jgi:hypothetical protein
MEAAAPTPTRETILTKDSFRAAALAGLEKIFPCHHGDGAVACWSTMSQVFRDMEPGNDDGRSVTLWFSPLHDSSYPSIRGAAYRALGSGRVNPFRAYRVDSTTVAVERADNHGRFGLKVSSDAVSAV